MATVPWADLQKAAGDAAFEPLPVGTYDVTVDTAEATQSSSGKDMIKVKFKVLGGPHEGRGLFNQFVISPDSANALAFFFRHMAAFGLDEKYFATNPQLEAVAAALVGKVCRVKVSIREWQGQDRNQVDAVMPPTPGTATVAAPAPTPMPTAPPTPGQPATPSVAPPAGVGATPMPTAPPVSPAPVAPGTELPF